MDADREHFKKNMKKALGSNSSDIVEVSMAPARVATIVDVDLPSKKQKKGGYISFRCTRETEDTITALMQKTGLSQSEIANHLIEISLPALASKYLGKK